MKILLRVNHCRLQGLSILSVGSILNEFKKEKPGVLEELLVVLVSSWNHYNFDFFHLSLKEELSSKYG